MFCRKIVELEEELRVVGNNLKSLEVSEEKVLLSLHLFTAFKDEQTALEAETAVIFVYNCLKIII